MTIYQKGTLHPNNAAKNIAPLTWGVLIQVADMQSKTYLQEHDKQWIPRLLSTLVEINALALSGLFVPSEALADKLAFHAADANGVTWYENLTNRLAAIFGSVPNADIGRTRL